MRGKGGGSSVYYRAVLGSGKFYWDTTSQIKRLRALVGNSKSKMLSLRINKIFLQRFSRCADQTYLHISARKSLLSKTPLGNCFEMFIVFCSITDKKNRKKYIFGSTRHNSLIETVKCSCFEEKTISCIFVAVAVSGLRTTVSRALYSRAFWL